MGLTLATADPEGTYLDATKKSIHVYGNLGSTCDRDYLQKEQKYTCSLGDCARSRNIALVKKKLVVHAIYPLRQSWYLGMLLP